MFSRKTEIEFDCWMGGWMIETGNGMTCVCDVMKDQSCWMSSRHFIVDLKHCFILNSIKNNNTSTWKQPQKPQSFNSVLKNKQTNNNNKCAKETDDDGDFIPERE